MTKLNIIDFFLSLTVLLGELNTMKTFMKIMYSILFASFAIVLLSSFFFGIPFFQWAFGLSLLTIAVSSVIISSIELSDEEIPDPYKKEEYYVD